VRAAFALGLLLAAACARADDRPLWYLQIDNDVVFGTDRWYTSGLRIARSFGAGEPASEAGAALRAWLRPANTRAQRFEWGVVQEIYTPNTNLDTPAATDRPYAGRLIVSGARHDALGDGGQTLEIDAGVRGSSALARQSQDFIHRFVPAPHTDWSRQLPYRFDGAAIGSRSWEFPIEAPLEARIVLHAGAVLGTIRTFGHAGIELRAGTGGTTEIAQPALRFAATPPPSRTRAGWSAFAGTSARYVLRDDLLQRNANPSGPPPMRDRGILRVAAGLAWQGRLGTLTFALVQDTREFEQQPRSDRFGILGLSFELF
jgi:hypothetical protein